MQKESLECDIIDITSFNCLKREVLQARSVLSRLNEEALSESQPHLHIARINQNISGQQKRGENDKIERVAEHGLEPWSCLVKLHETPKWALTKRPGLSKIAYMNVRDMF